MYVLVGVASTVKLTLNNVGFDAYHFVFIYMYDVALTVATSLVGVACSPVLNVRYNYNF